MDNNPSLYQPAPILPPPQTNTPQAAAPMQVKKSRSFAWFPWLLVVLLILSVVGVYIWQHDKVTKLQSSKTSSATATLTKTNDEYLYLYDYGIKVPLSSEIRDLYYVSLRSKSVNGDELSFSSETLTNEDVACSAEPEGQSSFSYTPSSVPANTAPTSIPGAPLGVVTISTSPLPKNEVGDTDNGFGNLTSHVKNVYLYYRSSQSACSSSASADQTQQQQKDDLIKALKNTQTI